MKGVKMVKCSEANTTKNCKGCDHADKHRSKPTCKMNCIESPDKNRCEPVS